MYIGDTSSFIGERGITVVLVCTQVMISVLLKWKREKALLQYWQVCGYRQN